MSTLTKLISAIGIGTMTYLAGDTVYAQVRGRALTAEEVEGRAPTTSTPTPAAQQQGSSGPVCEPGQVCATPTPAKKKVGPSKAVRDLQSRVNALGTKDQQLEEDLRGLGQTINLNADYLGTVKDRLQGYELLRQQVDALSSNPSLRILGEVFRGGVTPSKNVMEAACRNSATAYKTFADGEVNYQSRRHDLLGKISAAATNASYTPMQQAAEAGKFKKELDALDAQHKKGKDGTDKSAALCTKSQKNYDVQVNAFNARKKELEEWVKRNLTARPDQFTLRLNQGWLYNDGASQASTSAKVGYNTKRGWTFSLEGGLLYGEAHEQGPENQGVDLGQSPVGDNLRSREWQEIISSTTQEYNNFVQFGVDKGWKVGKRKLTSLHAGVTAGVYSGQSTKVTDTYTTTQLQDNTGALIGDAHGVNETRTTVTDLHDFVVGAGVELQRKFWGNLNLTLGGGLLYDTELNRTLPHLYLGAGANW